MKLKKIASLMLAGVMAVSMLAGCSGKGGNGGDDNKPVITSGVDAANVIAKLDEDTTDKVELSASSSLQSDLMVYANALGDGALDEDTVTNKVNVGSLIWIADLDVVSKFNSKKDAETRFFVDVLPTSVSDVYAVRMIAEEMDKAIADLELADNDLKSGSQVKDGQKYTKYDYSGEMAVVKVDNTLGVSGYLYAYTITRTPSEAEVKL